jgi:enoyl-CoA hydratase
MTEGSVRLNITDGVAAIVFDRPQARNSMTWAMHEQLASICAAIAANTSLRVATLRGAGGNFVAGTDIQQFTEFASSEDGIAYEQRIESVIAALEALPLPTLAILEGAAMGAG